MTYFCLKERDYLPATSSLSSWPQQRELGWGEAGVSGFHWDSSLDEGLRSHPPPLSQNAGRVGREAEHPEHELTPLWDSDVCKVRIQPLDYGARPHQFLSTSFPRHVFLSTTFNLFEDRNDDFIVLLSSVHFTVFATQLAPSSGLENIYHFEDYKAMKERNFAIF